MSDQIFRIYSESYSSLSGEIREGCLYLTSNVWGGGYSGEQHIEFPKEATDKLFALISLDEFIALCKKEHLTGLNNYLDEKGIKRNTFTI